MRVAGRDVDFRAYGKRLFAKTIVWHFDVNWLIPFAAQLDTHSWSGRVDS